MIAQAEGNAITAPVALDASECHFGRWYALGGRRRYGRRLAFRRLRQPHEQVHELASRLIRRHGQGERIDASELGRARDASDALLAQISQLQIDLALSAEDDRPPAEPIAAADAEGR